MARMSLAQAVEILKTYGEEVTKNKQGRYEVKSEVGTTICTGYEVVALAKERDRLFCAVADDIAGIEGSIFERVAQEEIPREVLEWEHNMELSMEMDI